MPLVDKLWCISSSEVPLGVGEYILKRFASDAPNTDDNALAKYRVKVLTSSLLITSCWFIRDDDSLYLHGSWVIVAERSTYDSL